MQGYFSLIQYCPCRLRMEVCNTGVILLVPELEWCDAIECQSNDRIQQFFGEKACNYMNAFRNNTTNRIRNEKIRTLPALEQYVNSRANSIVLTKPRSVWVEAEPQQTLEKLYDEIMGTNRIDQVCKC